ncbi:potassium voltage-gated channel subfamily C member 3-like [Lingula anatina]|uniref:Potassium voltage-gated channel subfamily C member 3-like n=1 Tax=Lingula anatina TaxID=7574 RepID=A0A1S3INY8_LINAN|nr:potassium voltage-gated channel subfamily C member 3-like [Lingula anatina]|eukprot:XP_013399960.1 potassium voltage-gated channel subfamily C member 3-like [Lingula anatina]
MDTLPNGARYLEDVTETAHATKAPLPANNRVTINISGTKFVSKWGTLASIPNSRLSKLTEDDVDPVEHDIFFERDATYFPAILGLYSTGTLHFPHNLCGPAILAELDFWKVDITFLAPCCRASCFAFEMKQNENEALLAEFGELVTPSDVAERARDCDSCRQRIWRFLEYPLASRGSKFYMFVYAVFAALCFGTEAINSVKTMRQKSPLEVPNSSFPNNFSKKEMMFMLTEPTGEAAYADLVATIFFTLDILARMVSAPNKREYLKSPQAIVDLAWMVCRWCTYIFFRNFMAMWSLSSAELQAIAIFVGLTNTLRMFRMCRLVSCSVSLKVLYLTLKASFREIRLLLVILGLGAMLFGPVLYYAEITSDESTIQNIPIGYWWAIVTMSTVGYGDCYPSQLLGYLVGIICVTLGLVFTGLPISVMSMHFNKYYSFANTLHTKCDPRIDHAAWALKRDDGGYSPRAREKHGLKLVKGVVHSHTKDSEDRSVML